MGIGAYGRDSGRFGWATRAALGGGRQLAGVARLAGGTTKGVYRLTLDDGPTVIAYLWAESENYWPPTVHDGDLADQFPSGNSIDLFEASHHRLASAGLRVPEIYLLELDRTYCSADLAILEDFPGEDLLAFYERDPAAAEPTLARLREGLAAMRTYRGPSPGTVGHVDAGGVSHWPSCEEGALAFALRCLAEATGRDRRITGARERLEDRLLDLAAAVRPRAEYSVVHGELGPDHVRRIGHADVAFTMRQYVQTDLEADRQVANTLAALILCGSLASVELPGAEGGQHDPP